MEIVSCALILDSENRVLVTQRGFDRNLAGKWEFPGGKQEQHESAEEALVREIMEELDLLIEITGSLSPVRFEYSNKTVQLNPFTAKVREGKLRLKVHAACKWLYAGELISLDWAEADIPIVEEFIELNRRVS